MNKILKHRDEHSSVLNGKLKGELNSIDEQIKSLNIRYGRKEINESIYNDTLKDFNIRKQAILNELDKLGLHLSNHEKIIARALKFTQNISQLWVSSTFDIKQKLMNLTFPSGLVIDHENGYYITQKINSVFASIAELAMVSEEKEKGLIFKIERQSSLVAGVGLEPTTFGL